MEEAYRSKRGREWMKYALPLPSTPRGILPDLISHPSNKLEALAYREDRWVVNIATMKTSFSMSVKAQTLGCEPCNDLVFIATARLNRRTIEMATSWLPSSIGRMAFWSSPRAPDSHGRRGGRRGDQAPRTCLQRRPVQGSKPENISYQALFRLWNYVQRFYE